MKKSHSTTNKVPTCCYSVTTLVEATRFSFHFINYVEIIKIRSNFQMHFGSSWLNPWKHLLTNHCFNYSYVPCHSIGSVSKNQKMSGIQFLSYKNVRHFIVDSTLFLQMFLMQNYHSYAFKPVLCIIRTVFCLWILKTK